MTPKKCDYGHIDSSKKKCVARDPWDRICIYRCYSYVQLEERVRTLEEQLNKTLGWILPEVEKKEKGDDS